MKIVIVGIGKTGLSLIKNLSAEKHSVVAIDTDGARVQEAIEKFDINGVVGNGSLAPILESAGVNDADLLIAVTDKDEINILTCLIAQVRSPEYYANFDSMGEHIGINMFVNVSATLADKIARILKAPAEVNLTSFGHGRLEIAEFPIAEDSKVVGSDLFTVRGNRKKEFLVVAIKRGEEVIVPNGKTVLQADDVVSVCVKHNELRDVLGYFGVDKHRVQSVMILGCDENAYYLASELLDNGMSVKVIGKDEEQCEGLKARLNKLNVICDDYNDKEVLIREGIDETDALVAMAPSEEKNIVASLFARTREVPKIITVIKSEIYRDMLDDISLNLAMSPNELAGAAIATYIRSINVPKGSKIISMHKIADGKAEALQFNIGKNEKLVGKSIAELGRTIKSGILLCAVFRKRNLLIPQGDTVLEEGDNIVVASLEKKIEKLEDILK